MVEIVAGELIRNETNQKAMGGTELIATGMHQRISPDLLQHFQIIHSRPRELRDDLKKILVCHDLPGDPEVQHLKDGGWEKYDSLVFVSNWQQQMYNAYLGVPFSAGRVMRNAIEPIHSYVKPTDKIRLIYTSTPHRGLNILYHVFAQLAKEFDDIELDVYSSFQLYGWAQRDEQYRELIDALRAHPKVNYYKSVSNDEIREALTKAHIFAYPSIWQETSCLCLIEAMSAGLSCVHSSLAALPETSLGLTHMYQFTENAQDNANRFYSILKTVIQYHIEQKDLIDSKNLRDKYVADSVYNWGLRTREWESFLQSVLT